MAGRATLRMRPVTTVPAAVIAPVFPAEKKPSTAPSFTSRAPTTREESFLARTALAGWSSIAMTSVVTTASARSCAEANGSTTCAGPVSTTVSSGSAASATATPARMGPGALSPPMASTAKRTGRL